MTTAHLPTHKAADDAITKMCQYSSKHEFHNFRWQWLFNVTEISPNTPSPLLIPLFMPFLL
jgi:hypothetical protein